MPAGAIETGRGVLGFGRRWTPWEMALSAGERGVEKDWAALVDVAAGGSGRRGARGGGGEGAS